MTCLCLPNIHYNSFSLARGLSKFSSVMLTLCKISGSDRKDLCPFNDLVVSLNVLHQLSTSLKMLINLLTNLKDKLTNSLIPNRYLSLTSLQIPSVGLPLTAL